MIKTFLNYTIWSMAIDAFFTSIMRSFMKPDIPPVYIDSDGKHWPVLYDEEDDDFFVVIPDDDGEEFDVTVLIYEEGSWINPDIIEYYSDDNGILVEMRCGRK